MNATTMQRSCLCGAVEVLLQGAPLVQVAVIQSQLRAD
jgi:hypothetical protein